MAKMRDAPSVITLHYIELHLAGRFTLEILSPTNLEAASSQLGRPILQGDEDEFHLTVSKKLGPSAFNCKKMNSDNNSAQGKDTTWKFSKLWMYRHSQWSPLSLLCCYEAYPSRFSFRVLSYFSLGLIKIPVPLSLEAYVDGLCSSMHRTGGHYPK